MRWPEAVSDGLTLDCSDCGQRPSFDYRVTDSFWARWVPDLPARLGVVCLPCLDRRCNGVGLMSALDEVQWIGTGHTVVLRPVNRVIHVDAIDSRRQQRGDEADARQQGESEARYLRELGEIQA